LIDGDYDPFVTGPWTVNSTTVEVRDDVRDRTFQCEVWCPAKNEPAAVELAGFASARPLVIYSHYAGGSRRSATFLCTHLASHGYIVAAMDHSEVVAPELIRKDGETESQRSERIANIISSRVPDVRLLIDHLMAGRTDVDADRIGLVGHSFGGWTVLAVAEVDPRVRAVVAMAPGGSSHPLPGVLPLSLTFEWGRDVPTLYLAAENDVPIPLEAVIELFDRTPASKHMFILRRADHQHFVDDVAGEHEGLRGLDLPGDAAWMPGAMRPMSELTSGEHGHIFVRGLTLAHLDASLRALEVAERFLRSEAQPQLAFRGVEAYAHPGR
jgi:dienelactone hydrolase